MALLEGPDHEFVMANQAYLLSSGAARCSERPLRLPCLSCPGQGFVDLLDSVYRKGDAYIGSATRASKAAGWNGG